MSEEHYIHHSRSENIMYTTPGNGRNKPHQAKQDVRHTRKYQYIRHIRRPNVLYATSGNTKSMPPQDRQYLSFIRKRCVWRKIYKYTPQQTIQYIVRHIRKYKTYATSGNTGCTPYQEKLCITAEQYTHHIRSDNVLNTTSGNTRNKLHQAKQALQHNSNYHWCLKNNIHSISGDTMQCVPHQEIHEIGHIRKNGCTPYQDI